jgi:hypothetical protein
MFKRYILQPNVTRVVATPCCSQIGRFLGNFGKRTQTAALRFEPPDLRSAPESMK